MNFLGEKQLNDYKNNGFVAPIDVLTLGEVIKIKEEIGGERFNNGKFELATDLFSTMIKKDEFDEFLTLPAYEFI